jgi:hypothetical protein
MECKIITNSDEECFIEITKNTFRNRIEYDWTPDENFIGLAVACNYNFKGHPLGFLKDNGKIKSQISGNKKRAIFQIEETETMIQAGPTLVRDFQATKNFKEEGFSSHYILSGPHSHIGRKKNGNYILGFTSKHTFNQMISEYLDFKVDDAIKLPGLASCCFFIRTKNKTIQQGAFPAPVVLIFESKRNKLTDIINDIP